MAAFINAEQAKIMSNQAYLDFEIYKLRLASLIEESAKQGNTAVFTVLPKHWWCFKKYAGVKQIRY